MPRVDLAIPSGQLVSSAGYLFPIARTWAVYCSSHATGSEIRLGFGTQSGTNFATLRRPDGSGGVFVAASTNLAAWATFQPVTPFVRVEMVGAPSSEARSFFLVPAVG